MPVVAQHRLEQVLVHRERRGRHAGADVRDARRARAGPAPCRPRRTGRAAPGRRRRRPASAATTACAGQPLERRSPVAAVGSPPGPSAQLPPRPISIDQHLGSPRAASAAATLRAEATEISCSLERPPERTAIRRLKEAWGVAGGVDVVGAVGRGRRRRSWSSGVVGVVVGGRRRGRRLSSSWSCVVGAWSASVVVVGRRRGRGRRGRRRRRHQVADRDRHGRALLRPCRCAGSCASTRPSCCGSVTSCWIDRHRQPGLLQQLRRRLLVVPRHVRHRTSSGPFETVSVTVDARRRRRARRTGSARRPCPTGAAFATSHADDLEARRP